MLVRSSLITSRLKYSTLGAKLPEVRAKLWQEKRVFFLTPEVRYLLWVQCALGRPFTDIAFNFSLAAAQVAENDLYRGSCPAEAVVCVVVDEAHRAVGGYAYCGVINVSSVQYVP